MFKYNLKCNQCNQIIGQIQLEDSASDELKQEYKLISMCDQAHSESIDLELDQ